MLWWSSIADGFDIYFFLLKLPVKALENMQSAVDFETNLKHVTLGLFYFENLSASIYNCFPCNDLRGLWKYQASLRTPFVHMSVWSCEKSSHE